MIDTLLLLFERNLDYARRLVADVPDADMAAQPAAGMNHPAWVLGHLALTSDRNVWHRFFGQPAALPASYVELFAPGVTPTADRTAYPPKEELIEALSSTHERVAALLREQAPGFEKQPVPDEAFAKRFPSLDAALTYVMLCHEQVHLGQLSTWRRVRGLPAA